MASNKKTGRTAKHHLLIFEIPEGFGLWPASIRCSLPNWIPNHGSAKRWNLVSFQELSKEDRYLLMNRKLGLLVPRTFWDFWYRWLSDETKTKAFSALCLESHQIHHID